ncbi:MAG: hypothetical protein ACK4FF_13265, partial [Limnobacter sp.]
MSQVSRKLVSLFKAEKSKVAHMSPQDVLEAVAQRKVGAESKAKNVSKKKLMDELDDSAATKGADLSRANGHDKSLPTQVAELAEVKVSSDALPASSGQEVNGIVGAVAPSGFSAVWGALGLGAAAAAAGGGGGGSSAAAAGPTTKSINGVVIDGYIRDGKVFLDEDRDGIHDQGEAFTYTDKAGKYELIVDSKATGVVRVVGGVNINPDGTDGAPNTAVLTAPLVVNGTNSINLNVTPITSLVVALSHAQDGLGIEQAAAKLAAVLGMPDVNLLTFDSIDAELNGKTQEIRDKALALNKVAAQVVALVNSVASALADGDAKTREMVDGAVADSLSQKVVLQMLAAEPGSFSDGQSLASVLNENTLAQVIEDAITLTKSNTNLADIIKDVDLDTAKAAAVKSAQSQVKDIDVATSIGDIAAQQVAVVSNKAPVAAGAKSLVVEENLNFVGVFLAVDSDIGDTVSYSIAGPDADYFNVDASTGALTFKKSPNFETELGRIYQVSVIATDPKGASSLQPLTIQVSDVLETEPNQDALLAQIAQLQNTVASLQGLLSAEKAVSAQQKATFEALIKQFETQISGLKTDLGLKDTLVSNLQIELAATKLDATAQQKALALEVENLKSDIASLKASGTSKDTEIAALNAKLGDLQAKADAAAKAALEQQSKLSAEIATLKASGQAKDTEIKSLTDSLDKAKSEAAAQQKLLNEEITRLTGEVDSLKVTVQTKDNEITALKAELAKSVKDASDKQRELEAEITRVNGELDLLEATVTGKDNEITALKAQLAGLQAKFDKAVKDAADKQLELEAQIAALEASGTAKDNEIASLKAQLAQAIKDASDKQRELEAEIAKLTGEVDSLKATVQTKDNEITTLKAELAKSVKDAADKQRELEAEITRVNGELDLLEATVTG